MAVFDLFSKRMRRERGEEVSDVFVYDELSQKFRNQLVHILTDACQIGINDTHDEDLAEYTVKAVCRERGMFKLPIGQIYSYSRHLYENISGDTDAELVLDLLEVALTRLFTRPERHSRFYRNYDFRKTEIVEEVNARFLENGIGYQLQSGQLVRVDSGFVHSAVVKPALVVLNGKQYHGARDEFLSAHEHYRHGKHKEALNDALKSFESTMKAICDKRSWEYKKGDAAKGLIATCLKNGLVPPYWENHFAGLRQMLESSVPVVRNKESGHGQGVTPTEVPAHLVSYALHMTASTILFLAEADKALS